MTRSSRRAFLKLVAAGSAALVTGAAAPLARAATKATQGGRKTTTAAASPAMKREIASQKSYVARALHVIREHVLPPGSNPAFTFRAVRPRRRNAR
jgi:hypothetical protein